MRVVVATIVHHPDDARIRHRQIEALLDAGCAVTYIAPEGGRPDPRIERVVVPRAGGRRRVRALRAARAELRRRSPEADVTLIHDPELVLAAGAIAGPKVWDVHEDVVAQLADKAYIPRVVRPLARTFARWLERRGARRFDLLIAEEGYAARFPDATLVRNTVAIPADPPASERGRAVYLGRVSAGRGVDSLAALGEALGDDVALDVIGPIDADVADVLPPSVTVRGFVPNHEALPLIDGATVGLALLRDLPNYRHSMPTKLLEYLARGIPVITTPLPEAVAIVEDHDCGVVVGFDDPVEVAEAIRALNDDDAERARLGANGRAAVAEHFAWEHDAARFVAALREAARDS